MNSAAICSLYDFFHWRSVSQAACSHSPTAAKCSCYCAARNTQMFPIVRSGLTAWVCRLGCLSRCCRCMSSSGQETPGSGGGDTDPFYHLQGAKGPGFPCIEILTLPMIRLLSSKAQGRNGF